MAKDGSRGHKIDQITSGIDEQQTLISRTINFVFRQLPAWRDDTGRPAELSENKLNLQLCKFLDIQARNYFPMVRFDHEEYQTGHRSVDLSASPLKSTIIGVNLYSIYTPFLVLECKRLPAPSRDREMEYVTGGKEHKTGGIQRFKLGLHGADLDLVVMIGYVQEHSIRHWHQKINDWITELANGIKSDCCAWNADEILEPIYEHNSNELASYRSFHARIGHESDNDIQIRHLWILMNK